MARREAFRVIELLSSLLPTSGGTPRGTILKRALIAFFVLTSAGVLAGAQELHWAFRRVTRPALPQVTQAKWVRNPIDVFVLAGLDEKQLAPNPPADRRTLIRRVTFDLTGLPPTPEETQTFLNDRSSDAYEKVVRRLLASPHYGERWAQHWLDVVRFAETNGYEHDGDRLQAWRYRDWVIKALNEDKPYDRFLTEQIAGDELGPDDFDLRVATGFLRTGPQHITGGNQDDAVNRQEWLTEATNGIGNAVLGLTVGCARCHDHKYDPISQADYYRMQAFFAASDNHEFKKITPEQQKAFEEAEKKHKERLKPITDQIAAIEKPYREKLRVEKMAKLAPEYSAALAVPAEKRTAEQKKLVGFANVQLNIMWDEVLASLNPEDRARRAVLRQQMHKIDLEAPEPLPIALSVADVLNPVPKAVMHPRGDPHIKGPEVSPGFLTIMGGRSPAHIAAMPNGAKTTGRRLSLAKWIADPRNPLTARVMVNRLWHYYFGRGIVPTPNDYGKNGMRPTNPELLDWLAAEFMQPSVKHQAMSVKDSGSQRSTLNAQRWSLKHLHYLILTSNAYRQSSAFDSEKAAIDPDNTLVWRMNRKRLDAESLRDTVLAVAGTLNPRLGGPSIRVPLEPEVYDTIFTEQEPDNLWPVDPDPKQHVRRSLYLLRKRNVRLPMLAVFDLPDMMSSCGARGQSVHALQALTLINSDLMLQQSRAFAKRLLTESPNEDQRIHRLFTLALNRPPTVRERSSTRRLLQDQRALLKERISRGEKITTIEGLPAGIDPTEAAAWVDLCLATLNRNEFLYVG